MKGKTLLGEEEAKLPYLYILCIFQVSGGEGFLQEL